MKTPEQFDETDYRPFYDQQYADEDKYWNVVDIEKYAAEHGKKEKVSISDLERLLVPLNVDELPEEEKPESPEFMKRVENVDMSYPILVIDYGNDKGPDGYLVDESKGLWIADGVHRIYKAKQNGHKSIDALIITDVELNNIDHESF